MSRFGRMISQGLIAMLSLFNWLKSRLPGYKKTCEGEKNILVMLREYGIGDVICFLSVLHELPRLYPAKDGYRIFLGTDESACNFLKRTGVPLGIELLPLRMRDRDSVADFCYSHRQLSAYTWEESLSLTPMGVYVKFLLMGIDCKLHMTVVGGIEPPGRLGKLLEKFLPSLRKIEFPAETMLFEIYEKALSEFFGRAVALDLPHIPVLGENRFAMDSPYCIMSVGIAPGHANAPRAWPLERFAAVADFIISEMGMMVCLCGEPAQQAVTKEFMSLVAEENRRGLRNLVGETNFTEWVELTRGAKFVFGNDSGYIHLAAAVCTQSFVIMGYHNHGRLFPYRLPSGKVLDDYCLPILIESDAPPCTFCNCPWLFVHKPEAVEKYNLCRKESMKNGVYICVASLNVDKAIKTLKEWYSKHNRGSC